MLDTINHIGFMAVNPTRFTARESSLNYAANKESKTGPIAAASTIYAAR